MRYLGGKMRQSRQIVAAIDALYPDFKTYVEPFCGALWSATAVMRRHPGRRYVLSDVNPYLMCTWQAGLAGWDPPPDPTEADYFWYKKRRPVDDPMTGYLGFAWAFAGKFFGTPARTNGKFTGSYSTTLAKIRQLREVDVRLYCRGFDSVRCSGAMVYLDPPYAGRNVQSRDNVFDRAAYYAYADKLAKANVVIASEFLNPRGWPVIHDYGDTVVRHHSGGDSDGTCELLMRVPGLTPPAPRALSPATQLSRLRSKPTMPRKSATASTLSSLAERDYTKARIVGGDGKVRHSKSNDDAVARAMLVHLAAHGTSDEVFAKIVKANGLGDKLDPAEYKSAGLFRMTLGNSLRALVRGGTPVVIGDVTVKSLEQRVALPEAVANKPKKTRRKAA